MTQTISQASSLGARFWVARVLFVSLVILLCVFFVIGIESHYKLMLINNVGTNPAANSPGEFQLSPIAGMPGATSGLKEGDLLLTVNGMRISSNVMSDIQKLLLSPDHELTVEVRGSDGTSRLVKISLDESIPVLFGLSAISIARFQILLDILLVLGFCIPALIIFWRKPNDRLTMFVSITLILISFRYSKTILYEPNILASLLVFVIYTAARIFLLIFLFVFPNGVYVPNWTKRFVLVGVVWAVISLFVPGLYGPLGGVLEIAILTAGLWAQVYRYRHISSVQEKQQTKWIVFGIVVAFAANYLLLLAGFLPIFRGSDLAIFRYQLISQPVIDLSLLAIPLTVSVSVFRFHLYEIDIIINRALVYGTLTAVISGLAVALTGFFQRLTLALTSQRSEAAIVMTTLIVASAITPLKNYVQTMVDLHFKEAPNPSKRLKSFIETLHKRLFEVDAEQITRQLLEQVVLAFGASGGAVYLNGEQPTHATRGWDGRGQLSVQIRGAEKDFGCLALGQRVNGSNYTNHDHQLIREVVNEIAFAIEQDQVRI